MCGVGLEKMTREEKLQGPLRLDTFNEIVNELATRGSDQGRQAFERVLVGEKLDASEKSLVRTCYRNKYRQDLPFTLPATDRSQTRELLLRFDPQKSKTLTVQKGDTFIRIARKVYPKLSQWAAIDALEFINDHPDAENLRVNQMLKVYEYEVLRDEQVSWTKQETNAGH